MSNKASGAARILRVAIPAPLHRLFDYLPPADHEGSLPEPGVRVSVPFGRGRKVGILVDTGERSELPASRLKQALAILDEEPLLDGPLLKLLRWASDYYRHPPGEVFNAALPHKLRAGDPVKDQQVLWRVSDTLPQDAAAMLIRAPRQAQLLEYLQAQCTGITREQINELEFDASAPLRALQKRGWANCTTTSRAARLRPHHFMPDGMPTLNAEQQHALSGLTKNPGFVCSLLFGVTGSGKTEVYLRLIQQVLDAGQQTLLLVPEISLTPQLLGRFEKRFAEPITVLHSGLGHNERLHNWRTLHEGHAKILIGTRSAVFASMPNLGLIIVDEEHDSSLKQQEGFRYSARDLAVVRARRLDLPIVLGTATPSLETLNNALCGKYQLLHLRNRAGGALKPAVELVDLRTEPSHQGLSTRLVSRATQHLHAGGQVLFFLNRRGYAPAWYCNQCGWIADCKHCDAHLTYHQNSHSLRCHHCAAREKVIDICPQCESELQPVGQGTERIETELTRTFPDFQAARMDRDVVRTRADLEQFLDRVNSGEVKILIGTQMLAKGHHFPNVTLVAVLNADQGLFGVDFRSTEKLAQTIVQVSGRAGRADKPGEVMIQTSFPEHPLLQTLISDGYEAFTEAALAERQQTHWPPYSHLAMLRVRSTQQHRTMEFLQSVKVQLQALANRHNITVLGPVVAPMARRAGQQHGQLLLQGADRAKLNAVLTPLCIHLSESPPVKGVRWSLDVDPIELF